MSFRERSRLEKKIEFLYSKASTLSDDKLKSELARFICVLANGYLEVAFQEIVVAFTHLRASPEVKRYVERQLDRFQNPKTEKIFQLFEAFDRKRVADLRTFVEGELRDSVDSIVANRNAIVHGHDVGIGLVTIRKYYDNSRRVVEKVRTLFE